MGAGSNEQKSYMVCRPPLPSNIHLKLFRSNQKQIVKKLAAAYKHMDGLRGERRIGMDKDITELDLRRVLSF